MSVQTIRVQGANTETDEILRVIDTCARDGFVLRAERVRAEVSDSARTVMLRPAPVTITDEMVERAAGWLGGNLTWARELLQDALS